jgi:hypothetical protein
VRLPSDGAIIDGAAFTNADGASLAALRSGLAALQAVGQWSPPNCGGAACTDATTPTAQGISAPIATTCNGPMASSSQRIADGNLASDFVVRIGTFGLAN